jgi:hypothetical protein
VKQAENEARKSIVEDEPRQQAKKQMMVLMQAGHGWQEAARLSHELRNEVVRRISGRKGVYRTISGLLEGSVHTRLIPAEWLECRKEGGSAACRGQRPRKRKSSILWVVSARRVWSSLDWLNSSSSGLLADASER